MRRATFDYNKLKGRIKEKLDTQESYAKALGISVPSLIKKLNNKSQFNQTEIWKSREILDINLEELDEYFFSIVS